MRCAFFSPSPRPPLALNAPPPPPVQGGAFFSIFAGYMSATPWCLIDEDLGDKERERILRASLSEESAFADSAAEGEAGALDEAFEPQFVLSEDLILNFDANVHRWVQACGAFSLEDFRGFRRDVESSVLWRLGRRGGSPAADDPDACILASDVDEHIEAVTKNRTTLSAKMPQVAFTLHAITVQGIVASAATSIRKMLPLGKPQAGGEEAKKGAAPDEKLEKLEKLAKYVSERVGMATDAYNVPKVLEDIDKLADSILLPRTLKFVFQAVQFITILTLWFAVYHPWFDVFTAVSVTVVVAIFFRLIYALKTIVLWGKFVRLRDGDFNALFRLLTLASLWELCIPARKQAVPPEPPAPASEGEFQCQAAF